VEMEDAEGGYEDWEEGGEEPQRFRRGDDDGGDGGGDAQAGANGSGLPAVTALAGPPREQVSYGDL